LADALRRMAGGARAGERLWPLAGGTDLMVLLNFGLLPGRRFLDLWGLAPLRRIRLAKDALVLGALSTYTDVVRSPLVGRHLAILQQAAREVGGIQIQNRGTLGGNLVNASPAGDTLPVFLAAGAELVTASAARGERMIPIERFYLAYRKTALEPDELLVAIRVPHRPRGTRSYFRKVGTRAAQAISKVVIVATARPAGRRRLADVRIAVGSVAPTVVSLPRTEAYLARETLTPAAIAEAGRLAAGEIRPIDDLRSTAAYRRFVTANLVREFVESTLGFGDSR
jgi:CO/xanthine dehydrogenase FAD-binding subunit